MRYVLKIEQILITDVNYSRSCRSVSRFINAYSFNFRLHRSHVQNPNNRRERCLRDGLIINAVRASPSTRHDHRSPRERDARWNFIARAIFFGRPVIRQILCSIPTCRRPVIRSHRELECHLTSLQRCRSYRCYVTRRGTSPEAVERVLIMDATSRSRQNGTGA